MPRTQDAYHYAVETRPQEQARPRDAYAYAVETRPQEQARPRDAYVYAAEHVVATENPSTLYIYNPDTEVYERRPWFYWDTISSTWKQVF